MLRGAEICQLRTFLFLPLIWGAGSRVLLNFRLRRPPTIW